MAWYLGFVDPGTSTDRALDSVRSALFSNVLDMGCCLRHNVGSFRVKIKVQELFFKHQSGTKITEKEQTVPKFLKTMSWNLSLLTPTFSHPLDRDR